MVGTHDAEKRIIQAGLTRFLEKGTPGATVPDIIALAGAGVGSFYRYFPDKRALANRIVSDTLTTLLGKMEHVSDTSRPVRLQIHEIFDVMVHYVKRYPDEMRFCFLYRHDDYIHDANRELFARIDEILLALFERASAEGFFRLGAIHLPLMIYTSAFSGMIKGFADGTLRLSDEEIEWVESGCWRAVSR